MCEQQYYGMEDKRLRATVKRWQLGHDEKAGTSLFLTCSSPGNPADKHGCLFRGDLLSTCGSSVTQELERHRTASNSSSFLFPLICWTDSSILAVL